MQLYLYIYALLRLTEVILETHWQILTFNGSKDVESHKGVCAFLGLEIIEIHLIPIYLPALLKFDPKWS